MERASLLDQTAWQFGKGLGVSCGRFAKSGGTKKNSSDVAFHRTSTVLTVLSVSDLEEVGCQKMIALDMS